MKGRPSKTTNRLHFSDIAPDRFEDLCLALVYPLAGWRDIRHYGRLGGDGGVDIQGIELVDGDEDREWLIQCRRYSKATKSTLTKAVDDALAKVEHPPDVLLVIVACDVSRAAHEAFDEYASSKGVLDARLWTASTLEASLHSERRDLLFTYFGISEPSQARRTGITRNISLKRRLRSALLKGPGDVDWDRATARPMEKFNCSESIIRSVDDTSYPDMDDSRVGSGWFKLEVWDFYHNGLEFVVGIDHAVVGEDGKWAIVRFDQSFDETKYRGIKLFRVARIPYRNIVDFDPTGDEYYPSPHIYCTFCDDGTPYEGFRWVLIDDEHPWEMEASLQFELDTT